MQTFSVLARAYGPAHVLCSSSSSSSSSSCCSAAASAALPPGLALLQQSRRLSGYRGGGCQHPSNPKPLRHHAASPSDVLVELVVLHSSGAAAPACLLPSACPLSEELQELLTLGALSPATLAPTLASLTAHLQRASAAEVAALRHWPAFIALLERSLELAAAARMGPEPPVLLLHVLSLLRFEDEHSSSAKEGESLREGYAAFYRLLANALEDACKRHPAGLTPQVMLSAFESWARMGLEGATPLKATAFAGRLRELIKGCAFSVEESARLLCCAAAILRRSGGAYTVNSYDLNALATRISGGLGQLSGLQLEELAWACGAFSWPVYQAPVQLLDALAQEAVLRLGNQTVHRSVGNGILSTAVRAAHSLRPRLGQALRERIAGWANEEAAAAPPSPCAVEAAVAASGSAAAALVSAHQKPCTCMGIWDCSADCEKEQQRRQRAVANASLLLALA